MTVFLIILTTKIHEVIVKTIEILINVTNVINEMEATILMEMIKEDLSN